MTIAKVYFGDDYLEIMGKKNAIIYYKDIDGLVFDCKANLPPDTNTALTIQRGGKTYSIQTSVEQAKGVALRRSKARSITK